jgi:hypothetical protein
LEGDVTTLEVDAIANADSLSAQALHGDASMSNLLRTDSGLIWNDLEDVCAGPVAWDISGLVGRARSSYMTVMPAELEDPATPVPTQTRRFRFEVDPGAEEPPEWWPGDEDPLVTSPSARSRPARICPTTRPSTAAIEALAPLAIRILLTVGDAEREIAELGRCARTSTWRPGSRTTTSPDAPM